MLEYEYSFCLQCTAAAKMVQACRRLARYPSSPNLGVGSDTLKQSQEVFGGGRIT